jgi:hypothetical protein
MADINTPVTVHCVTLSDFSQAWNVRYFDSEADREQFRRGAAEGLDIRPCPLAPHLVPELNFVRGAFDRLLWFVAIEAAGNSDWDICGPSCRTPADAAYTWNRAMARIAA